MVYDVCIAAGDYNKLGGIERYSVELAGALKSGGCRVCIVATSIDFSTDNLDGIIPLKADWKLPALTHIAKAIKASSKYFKFKRGHPDGLFISNGLYSFYTDFIIAQSVHRKAVMLTNAREPNTIKGYVRRILRRIRPLNIAIILVEWYAIKFGAKRIIAISDKVKRDILEVYRVPSEKIIVVHSGVNASEFSPDPMVRSRIRESMGFLDNDFLFLFSGNEFKRKGLAYAIEALAGLKNKKVKLVVAGRAKDNAFKKIADENGVTEQVVFIGSRKDFADWCAACDAFIFPTLDEPFGLVIVEALAAGLPVIVSDSKYAGASECLTDGTDSLLLTDPTDVSEMTAKMDKLVNNPEFCRVLSENGRKTAEVLSWGNVAKGIMNVWSDILNKHS